MQILDKPLYAITSVGLEDNVIDVVVMRMILRKAQQQRELQLRSLELISHFDFIDDSAENSNNNSDDGDAWQAYRRAA